MTTDRPPSEKYGKSIFFFILFFLSLPPNSSAGHHRGQVRDVRGRGEHHQHHLRGGEHAGAAGNRPVEAQRAGGYKCNEFPGSTELMFFT